MSKSLLFIPDISGYTNFIQTTEVEHSQHVIAELLEILIDANDSGFELAEIEGDALFFYLPENYYLLDCYWSKSKKCTQHFTHILSY